MRHWLNVPNVTFLLVLQGNAESITGTLVHCDETGTAILNNADGKVYTYAAGVVQQGSL